MENGMYDASQSILNHNHMVIDPSSKDFLPSTYIHSGLPDHNVQRQIMAGDAMVSTLHEEAMDNLYIAGNGDVTNGNVLFPGSMPCVGDVSCIGSIGSTDLREHFRGTSLSATSLANLLSVTNSLQENVISTNNTASASSLPSEDMRTSIASNSCNTINSSLTASVNCDFKQQDGAGYLTCKRDACLYGQLDYPWNYNAFPSHQQPSGRTFSTVHPSFHVTGNTEPGWIFNRPRMNYDHPHNGCALSNELSLSLGSCKPCITDMPNVPDQCSEVGCSTELQGCSRAFQNPFHDVGLGMGAGSRQSFPSGNELSLYRGSSSQVHLPGPLLGSRFLHVAQRILAEVASYALEYSNEMDDSLGGIESDAKMSFSPCCSSVEGFPVSGSDEFPLSSAETKSPTPGDGQQHREANATKNELVSLLQLLDDRYNQCIDQIQNVISAFHHATGSETSHMLARFALHTVSAFYKTLRERISCQILSVVRQSSAECTREQVTSFESSFIQKQWALQQLRKSDQQSWRPQRGLPESSVSVLRAWMFQNFLHPYPKDSEKHLLALKSGLTRSQVSNWFINARVRLWKPMIEEMYSDLNKKNRGESSESRSHGTWQ